MAAVAEPTMSVIALTCDRAEHLGRLLRELERQAWRPFEVVVVVAPCEDNTDAVLAEFDGRIKVVRTAERNVSLSRNLGISAAAGEVCVFIDDDALPADELWLSRFGEALRERDVFVGGPIMKNCGPEYEFLRGRTSGYGFHMPLVGKDELPPDGRVWFAGVPGGNMALRRQALVAAGGFDEFYRYYLDETDLVLRCDRRGISTEHLPDNPVYHFNAFSRFRINPADRDYFVLVSRHAYFALKNARDRLLLRLIKALYGQTRWLRVIRRARSEHGKSLTWLLGRAAAVATGVLWGCVAGLLRPRRTRDLSGCRPEPFRPFHRAEEGVN